MESPADFRKSNAAARRVRLAKDIVAYAARLSMKAGEPLREVRLAEYFHVSRTPVKAALRHLCTAGVVEHRPRQGFFLKIAAVDGLPIMSKAVLTDDVYLRLARDVLQWGKGHSLNVSDLSARYKAPRSQISQAIERAAVEGWIEKRSGYNWVVELGISSEADYARFYRFREVMEPAALLEPGYTPDRAELDRLIEEQSRIASGDFGSLSVTDLFEINCEVHERIVAWSGNGFFLDALRRANALRRIIEYTKVMETNRIDGFAREHVEILQAIREGDYLRASKLLKKHVGTAQHIKARVGIWRP